MLHARSLSCSSLVVSAISLVSSSAAAAACCGDASGLGEKLLPWEVAATTTRLSAEGRFGSFDGAGAFASAAPGAHDAGVTVDQSVAVRVASIVEMGATFGGVLTVRTTSDEREVGGGASDIKARARITAYQSAYPWAPNVSFVVGAVIPTGVAASASTSDLLSDVTGQGDGEAVFGATVDGVLGQLVVARIDGSVGFFTPSFVGADRVQRSPRFSCAAFVGPVFDDGTITAGVTFESEAAPSGAPPDTAGRMRAELALVGLLDVSRRVSLVMSARAPLPIDHFGQNDVAAVTASFAVRVGFTRFGGG